MNLARLRDLLVDVEDEVAALILEPPYEGAHPAKPGLDMLRAIGRCFEQTQLEGGPAGPEQLVVSVCRDDAVQAVLAGCGVAAGETIDRLAQVARRPEPEYFRGWLPALVRRVWYRSTWTSRLGRLIAVAALEAGLEGRPVFTCVDALLAAWDTAPASAAILESAGVTREKIRSWDAR